MSDTAGSRSDGFVDQLLLEAGMDDEGRLRPALLELRALADNPPAPSAEIAALMPPARAALESALTATLDEIPRRDELAARRRAKRRLAVTTFSVALSLSAGGAVAAASDQGIRGSFTQLNHIITSFVTGSAGSAGHPDGPAATLPATPIATAPTATAPAGKAPGSTAPAGTAPGNPTLLPEDPSAAAQPAAPPSDVSVAPETDGSQPTSPGKPGEVPASATLPGAVPEHLAEGLGKAPHVPVPPQVPLPGTLPAVPLP